MSYRKRIWKTGGPFGGTPLRATRDADHLVVRNNRDDEFILLPDFVDGNLSKLCWAVTYARRELERHYKIEL